MKRILNEQLDISRSNPIKARTYDYKHFTYPWHFHSQFELIYVEKGEGYSVVGDNVLNYTDHTLFFFGSDLPHWMQNEEIYENENDLRVQGIIVQFEKDFMQYSFANYVQFAAILKLLQLSQRGIRYDLSSHPEIQDVLRQIPHAEGLQQIILTLQLFQHLSGISSYELGASPNYDIGQAQCKDQKVEKVIAFLNKYYTHDLSLEKIASISAMNPTAFCRFFKNSTGKTLKEYITEMRIGYACQLLAQERMSMGQICYACGFNSISHFNRCFKKQKHCSPSEFKEKLFVS